MVSDYLKFSPNGKANANQIVVSGKVRFTMITSRLIRIEEENFCDDASIVVINRSFENTEFKVLEENGILNIKTEHLNLTYKIGEPLAANTLQITLLTKPYTRWNFGDKAVANLGGTVETLDRRSCEVDLDDGVCSFEGFSTIDDSQTSLYDSNGWLKVRKHKTTDLYFFGYGHNYKECVRDYCKLTGEMEMLPAYALGNMWSRYFRYSEESYLKLMDDFKSRDIPLSVACIDMDWHLVGGPADEFYDNLNDQEKLALGYGKGWGGYTWNKELFPDPKRFLDELHKRGLATTLNLHPGSGVFSWEDKYEEMANAMGIDPATKKPVLFDPLNPDFVEEYFKILHHPLEEMGVDFWWNDWQQGRSYLCSRLDGKPEKELECINALWVINHIHILNAKRDNKRPMLFTRYSGYGGQRFSMGFSGDVYTTWDSLKFQPYFTATSANVGFSWWSHDIGGHCVSEHNDELKTRWVQFGVFSPIFRLHCSKNQLMTGHEPWNNGYYAEKIISDYMRLRHQLFPYIYTMNYRTYKEQTPLMLPMYYSNPEERDAYNVKNQYWFGDQLIVSPITQKADESGLAYSDVWLPNGKWIDWFNGYVYNGNKKFECYRNLEQMPIFCKAGAIVPMQSHIEFENKLGNSENLEIVIAAGASGEFTMYEDDGVTDAYKSGDFATTRLSLNWEESKAKFEICKSEGNLSLIPQKRNYNLIFKGFKNGCSFFINNKPLNSTYDKENNTYIVSVEEVDSSCGIIIEVDNVNGLLHDNSDYRDRCLNIMRSSQTTGTFRKYAISAIDLVFNKKYLMKSPEQNGENRMVKAFYELAIQHVESKVVESVADSAPIIN